MKVCADCGKEIGTRDGVNRCNDCAKSSKKATAKARRKEREDIMRSMGLVKVKGALGGTYWE